MASCTLRDVGVSCSSHKSGKCWAVSFTFVSSLQSSFIFKRNMCRNLTPSNQSPYKADRNIIM